MRGHGHASAGDDERHGRRNVERALGVAAGAAGVDRAGRRLAPNAERHLRPRREMQERFADRPEWLRATREVAERCGFSLADLGYRFPEFPTAPGESQAALLRRLTHEGARGRYGAPLPARVRTQLERETDLNVAAEIRYGRVPELERRIDTIATSFHSDNFHLCVINEGIEKPDGVGAAPDTGDKGIG